MSIDGLGSVGRPLDAATPPADDAAEPLAATASRTPTSARPLIAAAAPGGSEGAGDDAPSVRYSENVLRDVAGRFGISDTAALLREAVAQGDGNGYLNRAELEAAARSIAPEPRYSETVLRDVAARYGIADPEALVRAALAHDDGNRYLKRAELEAAALALTSPLPALADGIPADWRAALRPALETPSFAALDRFVDAERRAGPVHPPPELVWNALRRTPLDDVKVVLLGQDPYHGAGEAMGLSFSVPRGVRVPSSLNNVYKELEDDLGIPRAAHGDLSAWADRGVLLLNTALTVREDEPGSHRGQGWEDVTRRILEQVNAKDERVVFLLLGRDAQRMESLIDTSKHAVVKTTHPSGLSARNGFFGSRVFSQVNDALAAAGGEPVDWALPA